MSAPAKNTKGKRRPPSAWRDYERRKADFMRRATAGNPADYEAFIRRLAKQLGL